MAHQSLQIVHRTPRRTRLRAPRLKGDRALAREVEQQLAAAPGVTAVRVNHHTGSVVIHHEPLTPALIHAFVDAVPESLLPPGLDRELRALLLDTLREAEKWVPGPVHRAVDTALDRADSSLRRATSGRVGLAGAIATALIFLGVRALFRGGRAGIGWGTYLSFALGLLQAIHAECDKELEAHGRQDRPFTPPRLMILSQ